MNFYSRQFGLFHVCTAGAIFVCILQIWLPAYYITGDGATHVYNAAMLRDHWLGRNTEFYSTFYTFSTTPNPNWFGHILLALLLFVFPGVVAEKILVTIYILLMVTAFFKLAALRGSGRYVSFIVFAFLFHLPLSKGFYNFSISTGLFLWLVWAWLRYLKAPGIKNVVLVAALALLTYFAHPVGFLYGFIACICIYCFQGFLFTTEREIPIDLRKTGKGLLALCCAFIPCILLLKFFIAGNSNGEFSYLYDKWKGFRSFNVFITHTSKEIISVEIGGLTLLAMLVLVPAISMWYYKKISVYAGLLLYVLTSLFMYCYLPDTMMGGSSFSMRAQYMLCLAIAIYVTLLNIPVIYDRFFGVIFLAVFLATAVIRLPVLYKAGKATENLMAAGKLIKPRSVVLLLNFSFPGEDEKRQPISDCNWLFTHPLDYLGAEKPMILLDNYEANTGYFPFIWTEKTNPYALLSKEEGIEGQPPYADLAGYRGASNIKIDYVVFWCYKEEYREKGHVKQMLGSVNRNYRRIYASTAGRTIVYFNNN